MNMADHNDLLMVFQEKTNKSDKKSYQDLANVLRSS